MLTVTIERQAGKHLGIRLSGNIEQKPGIFIADIQEGSVVSLDGRLQKYDRILFINGQDVREVELSQASALIQVKYSFFVFFLIESLSMWCEFLVSKLIHGHWKISRVQVGQLALA